MIFLYIDELFYTSAKENASYVGSVTLCSYVAAVLDAILQQPPVRQRVGIRGDTANRNGTAH